MNGGMSPEERHRAFWNRLARCSTIEALQREFAREAHRRHGAPQSTVEAFMYSLRERGVVALAEPETQRRLCELAPAQVADCIGRIVKWRDRYPDADDLLVAFAEILE